MLMTSGWIIPNWIGSHVAFSIRATGRNHKKSHQQSFRRFHQDVASVVIPSHKWTIMNTSPAKGQTGCVKILGSLKIRGTPVQFWGDGITNPLSLRSLAWFYIWEVVLIWSASRNLPSVDDMYDLQLKSNSEGISMILVIFGQIHPSSSSLWNKAVHFQSNLGRGKILPGRSCPAGHVPCSGDGCRWWSFACGLPLDAPLVVLWTCGQTRWSFQFLRWL